MKKIIFILSALCVCISISAQTNEAKAKDILDKSSAMLSSANGITAGFVFNLKDKSLKHTESFEGKISIKSDKFFIETPDRDFYFNGKTQWVHDKAVAEVSILEPKPEEIQALNPLLLFSSYKTGWTYAFLGDKTDVKSRKVKEISLVPKSSKADIKKILMQVSATDFMPLFFHIYYANGAENLIYVGKYDAKTALSDAVFQFDAKKFPGVEVVDLR
ncbi:MAG: outer-membrane lipoprotein carrier protein LolA [Dysgonamonadaceae bacterium]|jgi:outer membrane lipoprotein-sorting protein|nr:outer-membrane lipoprotein carrier protein LolA [Dysgonamonadaceae bacterium]